MSLIMKSSPGDQLLTQGFTNKYLPSVLDLIITHQILNDLLCYSNKYDSCLCSNMGKLYILLSTFLILKYA